MKNIKQLTALILALLLLFTSAQAESWLWAEGNEARFRTLFDLLEASITDEAEPDRGAAEAVLGEIRKESETDYLIAWAITEHWEDTVLDPQYRMFYHREDGVFTLEQSGLDFGGKHAFVVLGYELKDGSMQAELLGRCDAAAAAARAFPDSILICTGGATGPNNPDGYTEAGRMKWYLVHRCGIDEGRIFTDPEAMTTMDNAVNAFLIMKEQGVEAFTLVTSDYHMRWASVIFNAVAAVHEYSGGYRTRMVGNYNLTARPEASRTSGCRGALGQIISRFRRGVPTDRETDRIKDPERRLPDPGRRDSDE